MENVTRSNFDVAKKSLEELGYTMVQYVGGVSPFTPEEMAELDKLGIRVTGFDNIFRTDTFSTITYVRDKRGFLNFLKLDICKRFVKDVVEESFTQSKGVIFASNPKIIIKLNMSHNRITKFKSAFIGKNGADIKALSQYIKCSISLVE